MNAELHKSSLTWPQLGVHGQPLERLEEDGRAGAHAVGLARPLDDADQPASHQTARPSQRSPKAGMEKQDGNVVVPNEVDADQRAHQRIVACVTSITSRKHLGEASQHTTRAQGADL